MALFFYVKTFDCCYPFTVVNGSQNVKMYGGYVKSDFEFQNCRLWQAMLTFGRPRILP